MERCANASTQLDVDLAILDYLLYKATKTLLEASKLASRDDDEDSVKLMSDSTRLLQLVEGMVLPESRKRSR